MNPLNTLRTFAAAAFLTLGVISSPAGDLVPTKARVTGKTLQRVYLADPTKVPLGTPFLLGPLVIMQAAEGQKLQDPYFCTTQWTVILNASQSGPEGQRALERLCESYWYPLYSFARRKGNSPEDAQDLVQGFFAQLWLCRTRLCQGKISDISSHVARLLHDQ